MSMIAWNGPEAIPADVPPGAFLARAIVLASDLSELVPHLNNVALLRWVDEVASLHAETAGLSRASLLAQGRMWFVARHEVNYQAESFLGEVVGLATWIASNRRTTAVRRTVLWRVHDSAVIAVAATTWVNLALESRRPCRIPDADLAALCLPNSAANRLRLENC